MSELARLDATGQAGLVRDGEVSPSELVEGAIGRIEALNPELNAVISDLSVEAIAAAGRPLPDGPFRGVPMLLIRVAAQIEQASPWADRWPSLHSEAVGA
jgi:amidase